MMLQIGCFSFIQFEDGDSCTIKSNFSKKECLLPHLITAGGAHTCVVRKNQTAMCWGDNRHRQLGVWTEFDIEVAHVPTLVHGLGKVTDISAGRRHTCAVNDGDLYCWGSNWFGQMGIDPDSHKGNANHPIRVKGTDMEDWTAVVAGGTHTCARTSKGDVWCWGDNRYGQAGQTPSTEDNHWVRPKKIPVLSDIVKISAGLNHTCAHTTEVVECWGQANAGKTTRSPTDELRQWSIPKRTSLGAGELIDISAGKYHSCTVFRTEQNQGEVWCWGNKESGQIGGVVDTMTSTETMQQLVQWVPSQDLVQVKAGALHSCALSADKQIYCWGGNKNYQLGDNSTQTRAEPRLIGATGNTNFRASQITVGDEHACLLDPDGEIQCWGLNEFGQAGQPAPSGSMRSTAARTVGSPSEVILPDPPPEDEQNGQGMDPMPPPALDKKPAFCFTQLGDNRVDAPASLPPRLEFPVLSQSVLTMTATVVVTSCGSEPLTISGIGHRGAPVFTVDRGVLDNGQVTLEPGETYTAVFTYNPLVGGTDTSTSAFYTNLPDSGATGQSEVVLDLIGHGREGGTLTELCYDYNGNLPQPVDGSTLSFTMPAAEESKTITLRTCSQNATSVTIDINFKGAGSGLPSYFRIDDTRTVTIDGIGVDRTITYNGTAPPNFRQVETLEFSVVGGSETLTMSLVLNTGGSMMGTDDEPTLIAAGRNHTCVVRESKNAEQSVYCWGELYDPLATNFRNNVPQPRQVDMLPVQTSTSREITDIEAGDAFTCVRSIDGSATGSEKKHKVHCWGDVHGDGGTTRALFDVNNRLNSTHIFGDPTDEDSTSVIYDVVIDNDGNHYVSGEFSETIDCAGTPARSMNGHSGFLAKVAPNGNCLWLKQIGQSGPPEGHQARALAVDSANSVYVTGQLYNAGAVNLGPTCSSPAGAMDNASVFVAKYDSDGECQWVYGAGSNNNPDDHSIGNDIAVYEPAGGTHIYVVGNFRGTINFTGPNPEMADGATQDGFLIKLDSNGNVDGDYLLFNRTPPGPSGMPSGPGLDSIDAVAVSPLGEVVISGTFYGAKDFGTMAMPARTGDNDQTQLLVAKFEFNNPQFDFRWAQAWKLECANSMNCDKRVNAFGLTLDKDDDVYVAGSFNEDMQVMWGSNNSVLRGTDNIYLMKLNGQDGEPVSTPIVFGNSGEQFATKLAYHFELGQVLMTGHYSSAFSLDSSPASDPFNSESDIFLAGFDEDNFQLVTSWSQPGQNASDVNNRAYGLAVGPWGQIAVAGNFNRELSLVPVGGDAPLVGSNALSEQPRNGFLISYQPAAPGSTRPVEIVFRDNIIERSDITKLSLGYDHACAHIPYGRVSSLYCWGDNTHHQASTSMVATVPTPSPFLPPTIDRNDIASVTQLTAGNYHNCALFEEGDGNPLNPTTRALYCWGKNNAQQCGHNMGDPADGSEAVGIMVSSWNESHLLTPSASDHTCMVTQHPGMTTTASITIDCWGSNTCGQLNPDSAMTSTNTVHNFTYALGGPSPDAFIPQKIVSGGDFGCMIMIIGTVQCWGDNSRGQVGGWMVNTSPADCQATNQGSVQRNDNFMPLSGVDDVVAGENHACALVASPSAGATEVWCWGDNQFSQQGKDDATVPSYEQHAQKVTLPLVSR